jgi:hypothetical protein
MEIKGTAVIAIRDFVKTNYKEKFNDWLNLLPDESKQIYTDAIDSSKWYPLNIGGIIPTRAIADAFYEKDYQEGARSAGIFSAEKALTGIYKIFVKASTPSYIIQRASRVFATYYRPCEMEVTSKTDNGVIVQITNMTGSDEVIEYRIAGWMVRALEISGAKDIQIIFTKSITKGDALTEMSISWE